MNTKIIWACARATSMLIGVGLFTLGLLKEEIQFFWLGALLFMIGFAALAHATKAQNQPDE